MCVELLGSCYQNYRLPLKIREQIVCKTEQDKETILVIIDNHITHLTEGAVEFTGTYLERDLVDARTEVYDKTEGLAPRFRKLMDNLSEAMNDETLYSSANLVIVLVDGLRYIRAVYHSAPIGQ